MSCTFCIYLQKRTKTNTQFNLTFIQLVSIKKINVKKHATKFLSNFVDRILNYSYQMLCFF